MEVDRIIDERIIAKALALFDDGDIKYIDFEKFDIQKSGEDAVKENPGEDAVKENPDDNVKVKKIGGKKYGTNN